MELKRTRKRPRSIVISAAVLAHISRLFTAVDNIDHFNRAIGLLSRRAPRRMSFLSGLLNMLLRFPIVNE